MPDYTLRPIGFVRSPVTTREEAPKQGSEGAPAAWLEIDPAYADALDGIAHPRTGVFATRSSDRPNPVGLHPVRVLEISGRSRLKVEPLEAIDGTPVIDIKPDF